ncbi:MAG TPA: sugar ABC transporter permease [Spirochaetia bacterium]|nr:sugar ABC transporter permease [Spirochaetia bacterium]
MTSLQRDQRNGLLFISPWIIGFLVFTAYPIASSLYYSLTQYNVVDPPKFRGLGNYIDLLTTDTVFRASLYATLYMVVFGTIVITVATLAIAIILSNRRIRGLSFFRVIFFIPTLVPLVILCILWVWMLQPQTGLINTFLSYAGIKGPGWLADPHLARPAFIMMFLWTSGGAVIIYLAALQDIPQSLYEVAAIDGATFFHRTFRITIPLISPVILFNVITYVIGIFQSFAESFIITQGGPNQATLFYSLYLYQNAFQYFKMGLASAMAWILLIIALFLIALLLGLEKRFGYRQ